MGARSAFLVAASLAWAGCGLMAEDAAVTSRPSDVAGPVDTAPVDAAGIEAFRPDAAYWPPTTTDGAVIDAMSVDATGDASNPCRVQASLGQLSIGSAAAPAENARYFTSGTGVRILEIGGILPGTSSPNADVLVIRVYGADGFVPGTYPFDTDGTATGNDVVAYILADWNLQDTSAEPKGAYWVQSGSITFTQIDDVTGALTSGAVSADLPFAEISLDTGAPIPGGCTTVLGGLTFHLVHKEFW